MGRRPYSGTYAAKTPDVQPVLFPRGALADGIPSRDLYVSPQHAMFLDGVLVDAELLINGKTIRRIATGESVVTHSPYDAGLLRKEVPDADIHAIAWDLSAQPTPTPFAERHDIVFLADDAENAALDAVLWLMDSIMPKLKAALPNAKCIVVTGQAASRLPRGDSGALVFTDPATAPADVLRGVRLPIAPLRYGAGRG